MDRLGFCLVATGALGLLPAAAAHPLLTAGSSAAIQRIGIPGSGDVITIRPLSSTASRQGLRQFIGISGANSGARGLSMNEVIIPPGGRAQPHRHIGTESAVYLLAGTVRTYYGPCLEKSVDNRAGDFLFIPPDVPHMPVNLSATETAIALVSRNDAEEQERVELIDVSPPGSAARGCPPVQAR